MTLLKMSIFSIPIILVITIIRIIAINKLPKKAFLALWYLVLVHLLTPFNFPLSSRTYRQFSPDIINFQRRVENFVSTSISKMQMNVSGIKVLSIPLFIWIIGFLLITLFFTISYIRYMRKFQVAFSVKNVYIIDWLEAHKIRRTVAVRQSKHISTPLTYGIFRPVILLPVTTDWQDTEKLDCILLHENLHIRHFDIVNKLLLTSCLCIHWFNPFVWLMYVLANRDIELCCDEAVIHLLGNTKKPIYAYTLIKMAEKEKYCVSLCNNFSKSQIEERVVAIMKSKPTTLHGFLLSLCLLCTLAVTFISPPESLTAITPFTSERYSFTQLKEWFQTFKIESEQLVEKNIWPEEFAIRTRKYYSDVINRIEFSNGYSFGNFTEDGNEFFYAFYDTEHLVFHVPKDISAIRVGEPNCLLNVFPIE